MGMTITEKILCQHTDLKEVSPGMLINTRVDIALGNDITAPIAVAEFKKAGGKKVFNRDRVVFVLDHFHAQQGHQFRPALQRAAGVCPGTTAHPFLRRRRLRRGARPPSGEGDCPAGGSRYWRRQSYLHLRRPGAFATGVGSTDLAAPCLPVKSGSGSRVDEVLS